MTDKTPRIVTVELEEPIVRGETSIGTLQLRRPGAGELRGLSLLDLTQSNTDAVLELLPRISVPPITDQEAAGLSAPDLISVAGEIMDFLVPARLKPAAQAK